MNRVGMATNPHPQKTNREGGWRGSSVRWALSAVAVVVVVVMGTGCPQDLPGRPVYRKVGEAPNKKTAKPLDEATKKMHDRAKVAADRKRVTLMRQGFVTAAEQQCETDDQCTLTNTHCCGCNAMGKMTAIRSDKLASLIQRRQVVCQEFTCSAGMSTDPTCAPVSAVCLNNKCVPNPKEMGKAAVGVGVAPITDDRASRPTK